MKQLLPCMVLEVPCGPLSNAILKMGIDIAVADVLIVGFTMVNECVVSKLAIVCMVLLDIDAMMGCKFFERDFCMHFFFQQEGLLEMEIVQAREVVDKDGGGLVSFAC